MFGEQIVIANFEMIQDQENSNLQEACLADLE